MSIFGRRVESLHPLTTTMLKVAQLARRATQNSLRSSRRGIAASASWRSLGSGDSTSAIDYKSSHRLRPPPLPQSSTRNISAEEAVNNILYNTPPPSLEPFKKRVSRTLCPTRALC